LKSFFDELDLQTTTNMVVGIQIELRVRPDKIANVMEVLEDDKRDALQQCVFLEFNILQQDNHKIQVKATCESMEKLSEHMVQTHYRWHELKNDGSILSQTHKFMTI
jgi:putative heme degradation protein